MGVDLLEQFFAENLTGATVASLLPWVAKVVEFTQGVTKNSCEGVAFITSGGTSVPFEVKTVRSVVNFSSGSRGAGLVEALVERNWACVYFYQKTSVRPFRRYVDQLSTDQLFKELAAHERSPELLTTIRSYEKYSKFILHIPFDTVVEYLFLLNLIVQTLTQHCAKHLEAVPMMLLTAAAVSDYYIPLDRMEKEKITGKGGLTVHFEDVPKFLGKISQEWHSSSSTAPRYIISFKLETEEEAMKKKALINLKKYDCDAVVGNTLHNYKEQVLLYWKGEEERPILIVRPTGGSLECLMTDIFLKRIEEDIQKKKVTASMV